MISEALVSGAIQGGVAGVVCVIVVRSIIPKLDRIEEHVIWIKARINGKS